MSVWSMLKQQMELDHDLFPPAVDAQFKQLHYHEPI